MRISDWSSDVCSSDLDELAERQFMDVRRLFPWKGAKGHQWSPGDSFLSDHKSIYVYTDASLEPGQREEKNMQRIIFCASGDSQRRRDPARDLILTHRQVLDRAGFSADRKSTRLNSSH